MLFLTLLLSCWTSALAEGLIHECGKTSCTTYKLDLSRDRLELMDRDESGSRFGNAGALIGWGAPKGKTLRFATNAGIFDRKFDPLGLFIKDSREIIPINTAGGSRNFYNMKPNGVFYVDGGQAHVVETSRYASKKPGLAAQSGPLLLLGGIPNSQFNKDSNNKTIRSGVGVSTGKDAFFAISKGVINFYDFAVFLRKLWVAQTLFIWTA